MASGVTAPSGVLAIGAALVLRDLVQRRLGVQWAVAAIAIGAAVSGLIAPAALVVASVTAFALSELADLAVFTPLQRRGLVLAVAASGVVGIAADSVLFLWLAFGSLDFLVGQMIGKGWAVLLALPLMHLLRRRDRRLGWTPLDIEIPAADATRPWNRWRKLGDPPLKELAQITPLGAGALMPS